MRLFLEINRSSSITSSRFGFDLIFSYDSGTLQEEQASEDQLPSSGSQLFSSGPLFPHIARIGFR